MKKYESYKDSGIEWLGEIPEHWEVKKLKYIGKVRTGRTPAVQNEKPDLSSNAEINWYTPVDFGESRDLSISQRKIGEESLRLNEVELFPENSVYLVSIGATLGKVGFSKEKASANQQINIITFDTQKVCPLWGYYYLLGNKDMLLNEAEHTTLPILNQTKTKALFFLIPLLIEQQNIVRYIEAKRKVIDSLIADKKRLIELYEEEKTGIISHAVTKGLNPDVPLKASGIEWLGDIPEHWKVKKLKYVSTLINGYAFKADTYVQEGIPVIRIGDISDSIDFDTIKRIPVERMASVSEFQVLKGDILIAMTGATIGKTSTYNYDEIALLNQRVGILRPFPMVLPLHLSLIVKSNQFKQYVKLECDGGAQENIGKEEIGNYTIALPPMEEQQSIAAYLEYKIVEMNTQIERIKQLIDLLIEYRTALISEAVTGKIKVTE